MLAGVSYLCPNQSHLTTSTRLTCRRRWGYRLVDGVDDAVESHGRAHNLVDQLRVGSVVATDINWFALHLDELSDYLLFMVVKRSGDWAKGLSQLGVTGLLGEFVGPIERQVKVASPVVYGAKFAAW